MFRRFRLLEAEAATRRAASGPRAACAGYGPRRSCPMRRGRQDIKWFELIFRERIEGRCRRSPRVLGRPCVEGPGWPWATPWRPHGPAGPSDSESERALARAT